MLGHGALQPVQRELLVARAEGAERERRVPHWAAAGERHEAVVNRPRFHPAARQAQRASQPRRRIAGLCLNGVGKLLECLIELSFHRERMSQIESRLRVRRIEIERPAQFRDRLVVATQTDENGPQSGILRRCERLERDSVAHLGERRVPASECQEWPGREEVWKRASRVERDRLIHVRQSLLPILVGESAPYPQRGASLRERRVESDAMVGRGSREVPHLCCAHVAKPGFQRIRCGQLGPGDCVVGVAGEGILEGGDACSRACGGSSRNPPAGTGCTPRSSRWNVAAPTPSPRCLTPDAVGPRSFEPWNPEARSRCASRRRICPS